MAFDNKSGQPIADVLPSPETWVYMGFETIPHKYQSMLWVRPAGMTPRQTTSASQEKAIQDQNAIKSINEVFSKPKQQYSGAWLESFEYQDLLRPTISPQKYLDIFTEKLLKNCPSATVTPILVTDNELILEAKYGVCTNSVNVGNVEIDRFYFGNTDLFQMVYLFNSPEISQQQRDIAYKAVSTWKIQ